MIPFPMPEWFPFAPTGASVRPAQGNALGRELRSENFRPNGPTVLLKKVNGCFLKA